jgi:TerC family integral membrane protein
MHTDNLVLWIGFGVVIFVLMALDLGVINRKSHVVSTRQAAIWTGVWVFLSLLFNLAIFWWRGADSALEYLTGYLIEYSLSVDNLFVFVVLFAAFGVAPQHQHRVLFWGILGALVLRGLLIAAGVVLIEQFFWVIYIFGAFLIFTGIRLVSKKKPASSGKKSHTASGQTVLPVLKNSPGGKFMLRRSGKVFLHRSSWCLLRLRLRTWFLLWIRYRRFSGVRMTRLLFIPRTCLLSWGCVRSIFCWPALWANSTFYSMLFRLSWFLWVSRWLYLISCIFPLRFPCPW